MICLEVKNVKVEVQLNGTTVEILKDISFAVQEREVVSIVGPSGCGKTTLLHVLAGIRAHAGKVLYSEGSDPGVIGYAFQTPRLLNWLTMYENVALVHNDSGEVGSADAVQRALSEFQASHLASKYPLFCSEGEKERTALARAFVNAPTLVLMDEPFSHLDMLSAERIRHRLMTRLDERPCTVIFVTHNLYEAAEMSDRILVLTGRPTHIGAALPGARRATSKHEISSCVERIRAELSA